MNNVLLSPEEQVLSTLNRDGSRHWLRPLLSKGHYWRARQAVAYFLMILFVAIPYIPINGKPAILLDITARQFTILGFTFLPTDTLLLALFMLTVFLSIFLITALVGRVWCGWACPQTVYMEYLFRPIERLFEGTKGRGGTPRQRISGWRHVAKLGVYLIISMILAHAFLAYFVGVAKLSQWVRLSPFEHPIPFMVMATTTGLMMFDFGFFREQLCLIACPYGRFQSVLLDRNSLIVAYDVKRGEPRGKKSKTQQNGDSLVGDCVDCHLCVKTCPTGIDIRDGLQMECVNCTQCIDACDAVMERVHRPKGLIRYSSQDAIDGKQPSAFRPRLIIYPLALLTVMSAFGFVLMSKQSFDVTPLRNLGSPFMQTEDGRIQNSLRFKIVNRGDETAFFQFQPLEPEIVTLDIGDQMVEVDPGKTIVQPMLVWTPKDVYRRGSREIQIRISNSRDEEKIVTCKLVGPL